MREVIYLLSRKPGKHNMQSRQRAGKGFIFLLHYGMVYCIYHTILHYGVRFFLGKH